jgi:hypothetical protein
MVNSTWCAVQVAEMKTRSGDSYVALYLKKQNHAHLLVKVFLTTSVLADRRRAALQSTGFGQPSIRDTNKLKICAFSKHLQRLDYNGMASAAAEMGFDGVDLAVRKNGHVRPEKVEEGLPKAVNARSQGGHRSVHDQY